MANRRRLKKIWINPKFQSNFLLRFGFLNLLTSAFFITAILSFMVNVKSMAEENGFFESQAFQEFWSVQIEMLSFSLAATLAITFCLFLYLGLTMSHKVAGPMYRLNLHLKKLAAKEEGPLLEELHFRDGDYFPELEDSFNELVEKEGQ